MKSGLPQIISRLLDPVLVLPLALVIAFWSSFHQGNHWEFLVFLITMDVIIPVLFVIFMVQQKKLTSGWDIQKRSERVPLLAFVIGLHFLPVLAAWYFNLQPLAIFLTSFWVLTLVIGLITAVWKISIHAAANSLMVLLIVREYGFAYVVLFVLVVLVIWARVAGGYHRLSQAILGAILPLVLVPTVIYLLKQFVY